MSKYTARLLAAALMLVMVVSLMPVETRATEISEGLIYEDQENKAITDSYWISFNEEEKDNKKPFKVKLKDYAKYINPFSGDDRDIVYERVGMGTWNSKDKPANNVKEIDVPAFPINGTEEEKAQWHDNYDRILIAYQKHDHDLRNAPWHFDNNYHWKFCQQCHQRAFLRWHSDKNEDGICDFCDNPIHYYEIKVKDTTGGKITVSSEKGAMNDRIDVTVEPDAGYHLESLCFFNNNEKHSQLTRWEDQAGAKYHFVILNWDIDVEATFAKD